MKLIALWTVTFLTVVIFTFAVTLSVYADYVTCSAGPAMCTGECCIAGDDWCRAGPCGSSYLEKK